MKKSTIPFHPPLVVLLPVLALVGSNISMVPLSQAVRPILVALAAGLILWALFGLAFRSIEKGAMASTGFILVATIFAFVVRQFGGALDNVWTILGWVALGVCAAIVAGLKCPWTKAVNVVALMTFLVAVSQAGMGYMQASRLGTSAPKKEATKTRASRPDIYYIILDGHGSDASIERVFGLPREKGLGHALEKKGFYVAEESRSNYIQTELSLGATLNMDYLPSLLPDYDANSDDRRPFKALTNNARLPDILKDYGYQMIALRSSFAPVEFAQADFFVARDIGMTFIEATLLDLTPFGRSEGVITGQYDVHRRTTLGTFTNLKRLAGGAAQPRFIVAHVLCPHPPFLFGPNGEDRRQPGPFGLWDGPDYRTYISGREGYIEGYRGQVQYVQKLAMDAVTAILNKPGEKPIIVIQGDHGSKAGLDAATSKDTDLDEVFSIINALYVPAEVKERMRPDISPINTWRVILSELFGEDLKELPDRSYWSTYDRPMRLEDVTEKLKN